MQSSCMCPSNTRFTVNSICSHTSAMHRPSADADEIRVVGCYIAWLFRSQSKSEFIHSNRTQTGLYYDSEVDARENVAKLY